MWNILITLFILSSVIVIPNIADNFWIPKSAVFLIGGFILLAYNLISSKEKTLIFKNKWLGLILIYIVLSFGWYFYKPIVMAKEGQRVLWNIWNFLPSLNVILAILLIKDLVEYTDTLARWVTMAKVLCWVCFGFSIYALLQFLGLDQIFTKDMKWIFSKEAKYGYMITFMGNSMHSANFIAMLSPLCLMFKDLRYKVIYLLAFIVLILINSTISMAAFIIGFLVYLVWMKRIKLAICLLLLFLALSYLLYFYHYFAFSGRLELWKLTLSDWIKKPYTGWGLGSLSLRQIRNHTTLLALAVENDYLEILYSGGLILFALVCGYLLNLFKRIIMAKDNMLLAGYTIGFVVYLVLGMGSFLISIAPLALTGILYISALEAQI